MIAEKRKYCRVRSEKVILKDTTCSLCVLVAIYGCNQKLKETGSLLRQKVGLNRWWNRQKHSRHFSNKCKIVITEMWLRVNYSKIYSSHGFVDTLHYKFYLQNSTKLTTWESTYAELPWGGVGEVILSTRKFELLMVFRRLLLLFWTVIMLLLVFVFDVGIVVPISSPPVTKYTKSLRK